jgi:hypothetical protein
MPTPSFRFPIGFRYAPLVNIATKESGDKKRPEYPDNVKYSIDSTKPAVAGEARVQSPEARGQQAKNTILMYH